MLLQQPSRAFVGASILLFAASTTLTIVWCKSMAAMHDMPMPGGWSMSMMWMRMPGQSWPGAAVAFLGMWLVMMIAMMLPSLLPVLWRYRRALATATRARVDALTIVAGSAYFFIWTLFGAAAFLVGATLADLAMQSALLARAVPPATGAIVAIAGALQFSAWKTRHLVCCRANGCCAPLPADAVGAWRHGLRLGMHCVHCCLGLTAILFVVGAMNLYAMALVTAAISVERLAPGGVRAARLIGVVLIIAGLLSVVRAVAA